MESFIFWFIMGGLIQIALYLRIKQVVLEVMEAKKAEEDFELLMEMLEDCSDKR